MNLHEYQSKELFELYNLPVSKRGLITKLSDIDEAIEKIDFSNGCVAKVQAHTGGRGKVGGVQLCNCLLYTSPSPRDAHKSRIPSSA